MAVPKRKTSKSRRDQRSASKFLRPQAFTACDQCDKPILPHIVCAECGYYRGRKVMTTKLDRAVKRGEARRKQASANEAQGPQAVEGAAHEAKSE